MGESTFLHQTFGTNKSLNEHEKRRYRLCDGCDGLR